MLKNDLYINFEDEDIVKYRLDILNVLGPNIDYLSQFYDGNMPLITINELKHTLSEKNILKLLPVEKTTEEIYPIIEFIDQNFALDFNKIIEYLDRIRNVDKIVFNEIFYRFNYTKYSEKARKSLYRKDYAALDLQYLDNLKTFVENIKVLTIEKESKVVENLLSLPKEKREEEEDKYVDIINALDNVSSVTKKYIPVFSNYYEHTENIEEQLYNMGFYNEYCHSKFDRLKHVLYEKDKFEKLKSYYLSYFKDKKFSSDYKFDLVVLQHIKDNLRYEELKFDMVLI